MLIIAVGSFGDIGAGWGGSGRAKEVGLRGLAPLPGMSGRSLLRHCIGLRDGRGSFPLSFPSFFFLVPGIFLVPKGDWEETMYVCRGRKVFQKAISATLTRKSVEKEGRGVGGRKMFGFHFEKRGTISFRLFFPFHFLPTEEIGRFPPKG